MGHAVLRLEALLGVDRAAFTSGSATLLDAVNWALADAPDATHWAVATRGQIATVLGFEPGDISDPLVLLSDDDDDGGLDVDDECGETENGNGVPVNVEFTDTSLLSLDDLARELGQGIDCCDEEACCDDDGDCGPGEHCVEGECYEDECDDGNCPPEQPGCECPPGQHCERGECVTGPCDDDGDCAPGEECVDGDCTCDDDGDCPSGDQCVDGVCEDCPGECCDNADCDDGNPCTQDKCRRGECVNVCLPDCAQCNVEIGGGEGYCIECACTYATCALEIDASPDPACAGGIVTLTVVSECGPACGAMQWLVSADPADAAAEWIDGSGGETSCASYADPDPDETTLHVRLRCDALGPVTFRVEGVSPRGTMCDAECTIQVNSCVDLDVDSNNDNAIDPVNGPEGGDDPIEAADPLPQTPGKWLWRNNDDSDGNGRMDNGAAPEHALDADAINGSNDLADLPPLIVRGLPASAYPEGSKLFLETQDANAVRVFGCRTADCAQVWLGPGLPARVEIPIDPLDRTFALEGVQDAKTLLLHLVLEDALGLEICRDTLRVTVLHIDAQWEREPNEDITDPNEHPTGTIGYRAFPDATAPNGNWNDVVRVRVIVVPRAMNVPVHLGAFDPDDPSADADVVDNDLLGGDNRDNGHTDTGELQSVLIVTDGAGTARTQFRLAHQPGDNHRVAATLKQAALSVPSNNNVPPSGQTAGNKNDGQVELFIGTLTPMLTVWRKLNVEVDAMQRPAFAANVVGITSIAVWNEPRWENGQLLLDVSGQPYYDNFENGFVRIKANGYQDLVKRILTFSNDIVGDDVIHVVVSQQVWGERPSSGTCIFSDDDIAVEQTFTDGVLGSDLGIGNLPEGYLPLPDTSELSFPYVFAYIAPHVNAEHTSTTGIPFIKNMAPETKSQWDPARLNRGLPVSTPSYWTAYCFSSFQPERDEDGDSEELGTKGINTHPDGSTQAIPTWGMQYTGMCTIFVETVDDCYGVESEQRTVAHEIGHTLGLSHAHGGLMHATEQSGNFTPASLKKLREYNGP